MIGLYGRKQRKDRLETGGIENVEKIWKEIGGNQDEILSIDEAAGFKTKVRDTIEKREKEMLRRKVDEEHLRIYGGLREEIEMKTYLHGPMDAAKIWNCDFGWGTWTCQKEEKDTPVVERRRT